MNAKTKKTGHAPSKANSKASSKAKHQAAPSATQSILKPARSKSPKAAVPLTDPWHKDWKSFESNEITHSAAHYLLALASFEKNGLYPKAADLARTLGISRSAVSLQLKSLIQHQLIMNETGHRLKLTRQGADLVARISQKRYAFKSFLQDILKLPEPIAEADGCKVEHLLSEATGNALWQFLTFLKQSNPSVNEFLSSFQKFQKTSP